MALSHQSCLDYLICLSKIDCYWSSGVDLISQSICVIDGNLCDLKIIGVFLVLTHVMNRRKTKI